MPSPFRIFPVAEWQHPDVTSGTTLSHRCGRTASSASRRASVGEACPDEGGAAGICELWYSKHTMPNRREDSPIPDWAAKERLSDMAWLAENLHVLWPAAQAAFAEMGRGAVTVDTTWHPPGMGHPFYYLTQEQLSVLNDPNVLRMVAEYDPTWELIATLLKHQERSSTYRIGVPGAQ